MLRRTVSKKVAACLLSVSLAVAGIGIPVGASAAAKPKLNKKRTSIRVGGTVRLKVLHKKKKVKWSSNKKKIASVNSSGLVRGKKKGTAKITAKTGGKKYTCKVTVKAKKSGGGTEEPQATATGSQPTITPAGTSVAPSQTPGSSKAPGQTTASPGISQEPGTTKVPGEPGATDTPGEPGASQGPGAPNEPGATDTPGRPGASQGPGATDAPNEPVGPGGVQDPGTTWHPEQTSGPGATNDPATPGTSQNPGTTWQPVQTSEPGSQVTAPPSGAGGLVSSSQIPAASGSDTLTVGNMSVALGMSRAQVEQSIGALPTRQDVSPLGFDMYLYNPSDDYTNLLMVQFDGDSVVGMSTISRYFTYEDILVSGQQGASDLAAKGFNRMGSYDYEQGYLYTGDHEYVLAFVDHQGDGKLYGVEILAKSTSKEANGDTKLDDLFKAEKGSYSQEVDSCMAQQLYDWACAFRAGKGLSLFLASNKQGAKKHSQDMAEHDFVEQNSSDGTSWEARFDEEYGMPYYLAECVASRSIDAFGFMTWLVDDTDSQAYGKLTKDKDKYGDEMRLYLCTGFTSASSGQITYAALDIYAF